MSGRDDCRVSIAASIAALDDLTQPVLQVVNLRFYTSNRLLLFLPEVPPLS